MEYALKNGSNIEYPKNTENVTISESIIINIKKRSLAEILVTFNPLIHFF